MSEHEAPAVEELAQRGSERSRSRSPRRNDAAAAAAKKKRSGWDEAPAADAVLAAAAAAVGAGAQMSSPMMMAGMPLAMAGMPATVTTTTIPASGTAELLASLNPGMKKNREVYVGNLTLGAVTPALLQEFFRQLFDHLPDFKARYPQLITSGPAREVQISGGGKFAFVEFWSEELAATALKMDKTELLGRAINTGRPQGYTVPPGGFPAGLDVSPLHQLNIVPMGSGGMSGGGMGMPTMAPGGAGMPGMPGMAVSGDKNLSKKQRELYVGNLPVGQVDSNTIRVLFSTPCEGMAEYQPALGPPILNVEFASQGTFCFVEFQSEALASQVLQSFRDQIELMGRQLRLGRPSGYQPGAGSTPPMLAGMMGMQPPMQQQSLQQQQQQMMLQQQMMMQQQMMGGAMLGGPQM